MASGGPGLRALLESVAELEFPNGSDYHVSRMRPLPPSQRPGGARAIAARRAAVGSAG